VIVRGASGEDHYALLGLGRDAQAAEIRRAFRQLALRHHPDRAGPANTERFQRIALAYRVLSNPATRSDYDARLATAERQQRHARQQVIERLAAPLDALIARATARQYTDGLIELLLTRAEAAQGGVAAIALPVRLPCPTCGGCAQPGSIWCVRCEFEGSVREEVTVCIAIPPAVADGATFTVRVDRHDAVPPLRVRVRV
jgi:molecular chaperone DnaJ